MPMNHIYEQNPKNTTKKQLNYILFKRKAQPYRYGAKVTENNIACRE